VHIVIAFVMNIRYFGEFSPLIVIGAYFVLGWIIFTGIYYGAVIHAYTNSNLPNALLTIDAVFFASTMVIASILIPQYEKRKDNNYALQLIMGLRGLSVGISILLVANIASYFTVGSIRFSRVSHNIHLFYIHPSTYSLINILSASENGKFR
jgi:FtsH-binding integral membrane protein